MAIARRVRAQVLRRLFANFFQLLALTVSGAEWCLVWWLVPQPLPWFVHVIGPSAIYAANRSFARWSYRRRLARRPIGALARCYSALAFTSLFCAAFLVVTGVAWVGARLVLGAIAVNALASPAALVLHSDVDASFRWVADAGMTVILMAFAYGYTVGQRRLRATHVTLPLRRCGESFDGLRIVQISDIHIGSNLTRAELELFVARVNALQPDLLCITGDIIDSPLSDIDGVVPVLAELRAALGVFAILGNHDHHAGANRVEAALQQLTPFTVLRDRHVTIRVKGRPLHIVGLDDRGADWARGVTYVPYLADACAAIPPDEPVLLLCHRPDVFPQAAAAGVALTLSGHTHGGQIGVPWFNGRVRNLAEFVTAFDRGLFHRNGSYLYVNSGLGVTGQRVRLSAPREITVIEVRATAAAAVSWNDATPLLRRHVLVDRTGV